MDPMKLPKDKVDALDPVRVEAHLRASGWVERPNPLTVRVGLYRHASLPKDEFFMPRDKEFPDFALRMAELLVALGHVEQKRAWEVLDELSKPAKRTKANGTKRRTAPKAKKKAS